MIELETSDGEESDNDEQPDPQLHGGDADLRTNPRVRPRVRDRPEHEEAPRKKRRGEHAHVEHMVGGFDRKPRRAGEVPHVAG